ncbi:MAG: hypothetical protein ABIK15_07295 [Pseudomonadota bacterium]
MGKDKTEETPVEKPGVFPIRSRQKPAVQAATKPEQYPIENLAADQGIEAWEAVAMMRAIGWFPGKQVTEQQFTDALARFRTRPQGSGRI